jgi:hypothetical protein
MIDHIMIFVYILRQVMKQVKILWGRLGMESHGWRMLRWNAWLSGEAQAV